MNSEWLHGIASALDRAFQSLDPKELAYMALTSKSELPLRDRLAWELQTSHPSPQYLIAREWRKIDLAVIENGKPIVLLEAKALYSFDAARPKSLGRYADLIRKDIAKALGLAPPGTQIMVAVFMTHVGAYVPDHLDSVVKYRPSINKALGEHSHPVELRTGAVADVEAFLHTIGPTKRIEPTPEGTAFNIPVALDAWVARVNAPWVEELEPLDSGTAQ